MKRLIAMLLTLFLLIPAAQAENSVRWIHGGNADRVHLRAEPSAKSKSLGLYFTGTDAILIDRLEDWAFVMVGDVSGYIMSEYLTDGQPAQLGPWYAVDNPNSTWVNLRMSPDRDGMAIAEVNNGEAVHILGETADGWSYVEWQGVKGYMVKEYLSPAGESAAGQTRMLGRTPEGDAILAFDAPNGQPLYFVSAQEQPHVTFRDVNFDGATDIVVFTIMGASNFYTEFFVWDAAAGQYVQAEVSGIDYPLCNFELHPEEGIVSSHANNGGAGSLHEICLFRWAGTKLDIIRRAVSRELEVFEMTGAVFTSTTYTDVLDVKVHDYTTGEYGGTVLWEKTIPVEETEYRDFYTEETDALWQGLK